ncbi:MAG: DUF2155 domain-containing protein [Alphaproteobacteria bacterium]|nr:DUF2155 domain-containing protein [Alphaproteobacteria bacterium]
MRAAVVLGVVAALLPVAARATVPTQGETIAVVRALDKMTARVAELDLPIGQTVSFGALSVTARTCRVTLPEETPPESAAYLDIEEIKPGTAQPVPVFDGWMFASSPALSAMQDPIYDVWVIGCKGDIVNPPAPPAAPAAVSSVPAVIGSTAIPLPAPPVAKPSAP